MLLEWVFAAYLSSQTTGRAPTGQEQRAAYCLRVLRYHDETFAKLRQAFPQAEAQHLHEKNDAEQRALRLRYEAQLMPYLSELNLSAVTYSAQAADEDNAVAQAATEDSSGPVIAARDRMRSCRALEGFSF